MVEFALSWTLFFMITVIGVMDFGRAFWAYNLSAHASRAATRYAMVRGSNHPTPATAASIESYARSQAVMLDQSNVSVTTTWLPDNNSGSIVQVRVTYDFVPVLGVFQPATMKVGSRSRKVITF